MNRHLAYFLTGLGETLVLYLILFYIEKQSDEITKSDVMLILITNFVAAYSGFYLLPWLSNL